jgi:hypothetical protein
MKETVVKLRETDSLQGRHVRFSASDPRFKEGEMPGRVLVRSQQTGKAALAGTGFWGKAALSEEFTAVEASPELIRTIGKGKLEKDKRHGAKIKRASVVDVAIYAKGFWLPSIFALLVALAATVGAAASVVYSEAPLAVVAIVIALSAFTELGKALRDVRGLASTAG